MNRHLVFDTNVLISGYLWNGQSRLAIRCVKSSGFKLLYCKESIDELVRVLSVKFKLDAQEIYAVILDVKNTGKNIIVSSNQHPVKEDHTDNLFINLAIDGDADIIISGDSHLLKLKQYEGIKIITVSEFLRQYL